MMQKKKNRIIGLILVGSIISIMVLVTFYIGYNMEQKLREKLKLDIQKVAEQMLRLSVAPLKLMRSYCKTYQKGLPCSLKSSVMIM